MRRVTTWLEHRDPGFVTTRRSLRAAVVVPATFALVDYGIANSTAALFSAFGAMAFTLFTDFGGRPSARLRAYAVLWLTGVVFITVGTLCSRNTVLAVLTTAVVGFAVLYAGVVSPQVASGATAALLIYILPVAVPATPSMIGWRLVGWSMAAVIGTTAVMATSPARWHDDLRRQLAVTARALAALVSAHADGHLDPEAYRRAVAETDTLRTAFESTPFRPTGAGPSDVALGRLVGRMEWVSANAAIPPAIAADALAGDEVLATNAVIAELLDDLATVVADDEGHPTSDREDVRRVEADVGRLDIARRAAARAAADGFLERVRAGGGPTVEPGAPSGRDGQRVPLVDVDPSFRTRALAYATEMAADAGIEASDVPRQGPSGWWGRAVAFAVNAWTLLVAEAGPGSAWFANSVRGAAGLALAVLVAKVSGVSHGFWVVLGALSVLRSNAIGTGATVLQALAGTVVGFLIGSVILVGLGSHTALLWAVLPLAVLVAGIAPSVLSFAAGQAGFTVFVLILFNIIAPAGWKVGIVRIEDVAIGSAVGLMTGLLFWPRGATRQLAHAIAESYSATASLLKVAVDQVVGDAGPTDDAVATAELRARRLDQTFRLYVAERGAKPVPMSTVIALVAGGTRVRVGSINLIALPEITPSGPERPMAALSAAEAELRRVAADTAEAFGGVGGTLVDRRASVPALPGTDDLRRLLLEAFAAARAAGGPADIHLVLRMMWADERLEDLAALQPTLVRAAQSFHGAMTGTPSA
ncbi:MAG TPA: FUSC family protein [Acidimicrobiales bacterium]|nr:FUSC family protein [Acidimicrobiales bacterium]